MLTLLRFVDRDMFMRYVGGGVGHCSDPSMETYEDEVDQDDDIGIEHDSSIHARNSNVDDNNQQDSDLDSDDENQEEWDTEDQIESDDDGDLGPEDDENSDDEYNL